MQKYIYAGGYLHHAMTEFSDAYELHKAIQASSRLAKSIESDERFTEEQKAQRRALINLQITIMEKERDSFMDEAVKYWTEYRKMNDNG